MNRIETKEQQLGAEMALMYVLADMLESQMMVVDQLAPKCGFVIKNDLKHGLNKMAKGAKDFHRYMRSESRMSQLMIGTCSDAFLQFIRLMVDRCENDIDMFKIYNLVKNSVRSKRGWPLAETEADAFEGLINNVNYEA